MNGKSVLSKTVGDSTVTSKTVGEFDVSQAVGVLDCEFCLSDTNACARILIRNEELLLKYSRSLNQTEHHVIEQWEILSDID